MVSIDEFSSGSIKMDEIEHTLFDAILLGNLKGVRVALAQGLE